MKPFQLNGDLLSPASEIKFLGCVIQNDLRWEKQVAETTRKLRCSAARIRSEGRHFGPNDRRTLYNAWCGGVLQSNAAVYLPHLNGEQTNKLQRAANAGVRAIVGIPRQGDFPLTEIRTSLNIPSVQDIQDTTVMFEAWKRRRIFLDQNNYDGPITRGRRAGDVLAPDQRSWAGRTTETKASIAWNNLPGEVRAEKDAKKARRMIRGLIKK